MSYNIQGHAAERQQDHIIKVAETVAAAQPDVVALQEVHCRKSGDQGAQVAHLAGLQLVFGKSCEINGGDYGNAILTRGTIERSAVHPLPGAGEPRSLLEACISIDNARFTFFATHLAAWGRLLRAARLEQIAKLGDITRRAGSAPLLARGFHVTPRAEGPRAPPAHRARTPPLRGRAARADVPVDTPSPRLHLLRCRVVGGGDARDPARPV